MGLQFCFKRLSQLCHFFPAIIWKNKIEFFSSNLKIVNAIARPCRIQKIRLWICRCMLFVPYTTKVLVQINFKRANRILSMFVIVCCIDIHASISTNLGPRTQLSSLAPKTGYLEKHYAKFFFLQEIMLETVNQYGCLWWITGSAN